jgi:hypothetical protein
VLEAIDDLGELEAKPSLLGLDVSSRRVTGAFYPVKRTGNEP